MSEANYFCGDKNIKFVGCFFLLEEKFFEDIFLASA